MSSFKVVFQGESYACELSGWEHCLRLNRCLYHQSLIQYRLIPNRMNLNLILILSYLLQSLNHSLQIHQILNPSQNQNLSQNQSQNHFLILNYLLSYLHWSRPLIHCLHCPLSYQ
jgi:hypothetical protein